MTRMGDREVSPVTARLLDNSGELPREQHALLNCLDCALSPAPQSLRVPRDPNLTYP